MAGRRTNHRDDRTDHAGSVLIGYGNQLAYFDALCSDTTQGPNVLAVLLPGCIIDRLEDIPKICKGLR